MNYQCLFSICAKVFCSHLFHAAARSQDGELYRTFITVIHLLTICSWLTGSGGSGVLRRGTSVVLLIEHLLTFLEEIHVDVLFK